MNNNIDLEKLATEIIEYYAQAVKKPIAGIGTEDYHHNLVVELSKGNVEFLQRLIDEVLEADNQFVEKALTPEESKLVDKCNDIVWQLATLRKEEQNSKPLGELSKDELKQLTASELADRMTEELDSIQFDIAKERQEFFKFISGFNSYNYSYRNCMLLKAQADARGLMPVFASLKEWNKQGTSIKPGQRALLLCTPQKYNVYYSQDENGNPMMLPFTWDKKEIAEREKLVKEGILTKAQKISFSYLPTIFSITQTKMQESEKVAYLQQYNSHNTSEQNLEILNKELALCEKLGIEVVERETGTAALGFIDYDYNKIVVDSSMPVDARISTLTHELGHYLFHRHPEINPKLNKSKTKNPYMLSHENREIQAQLFSHIVLEGLGVDSESQYSLRYINGYLFKNEKNKTMSLSDVSASSLHAHLSIVHEQALNVTKLLKQEEISELEVKQLNDFMPDRYLFDTTRQRAEVILNETVLAQEAEIKQQAEKAQRQQKEPRVQKAKMVQSM